ncbi:MAG: hypothetical protein IPJ79_09770 [Bacteroidetes bacterium]|nr:hypothetical protein [Bacteroidota bacterium]
MLKCVLYSETGYEEQWKIKALNKAVEVSGLIVEFIIINNKASRTSKGIIDFFISTKHTQKISVKKAFAAVPVVTIQDIQQYKPDFVFYLT